MIDPPLDNIVAFARWLLTVRETNAPIDSSDWLGIATRKDLEPRIRSSVLIQWCLSSARGHSIGQLWPQGTEDLIVHFDELCLLNGGLPFRLAENERVFLADMAEFPEPLPWSGFVLFASRFDDANLLEKDSIITKVGAVEDCEGVGRLSWRIDEATGAITVGHRNLSRPREPVLCPTPACPSAPDKRVKGEQAPGS